MSTGMTTSAIAAAETSSRPPLSVPSRPDLALRAHPYSIFMGRTCQLHVVRASAVDPAVELTELRLCSHQADGSARASFGRGCSSSNRAFDLCDGRVR